MWKKLKAIGPGAMIAAAFIGPGTVTTATLSGAGYGYTLLWAVLFSVLATMSLQEMAARLGVAGRLGLGAAIRRRVAQPFLRMASVVLVLCAILLGNAAYEAGNLSGAVLGFEAVAQGNKAVSTTLLVITAAMAFFLLYAGKHKLIERFLIGMVVLMGLVFALTALLTVPDWMLLYRGLFRPSIPEDSILMVIGLIGTTVVPYNLFLHASSARKRWSSPDQLPEARLDNFLSIGFGGLITMAVIITSAGALRGAEKEVQNLGDLATQLSPLLGDWSTAFIGLGFFAAGLSSAITAPLAAAYAASEVLGWKDELRERSFRGLWAGVLLTGLLFALIGYRPIQVILVAQVANGLLLPLVVGFLLLVMNDERLLGPYVNRRWMNLIGLFILLITIGLGVKAIMGATGLLSLF